MIVDYDARKAFREFQSVQRPTVAVHDCNIVAAPDQYIVA